MIVLWVSQAERQRGAQAWPTRCWLSGLDPTGRDPLLLVRNEDDRKQTLRAGGQLDVCVVAIAGDRRGDFDELFDYLRDPDGRAGLEAMIGRAGSSPRRRSRPRRH